MNSPVPSGSSDSIAFVVVVDFIQVHGHSVRTHCFSMVGTKKRKVLQT